MRQYRNNIKETKEIDKIICNKCGKEIPVSKGVASQDVLQIEKYWGYFSEKDGRRDRFDLCEECYDELVKSFLIPMESED